MSTIPTTEELAALFDQGMLASEMARRFRLNDKVDIQVVQSRCAELHNSGTLDLLQIVESGTLQGLSGSNFFMVMHFFCQILPELEATPTRMMACVEALVTHGGEDMTANQPNAAFRTWCTKDPRRAREVIAAAHRSDDLASRHLTFALESINAIPESRQIALLYNDARRLYAITALGRMKDNDPASRSETFAVFSTLLESGADDRLRATMLHATAAILSRSDDVPSPEAVALVQRLVKDAGDSTIHQSAHVLWAYRQALEPDVVACLLEALEGLNPTNKGTVDELDLGLQSLLEHGHEEAAIAYVIRLLSSADGSLRLKDFDGFSRTLISAPPERLSRVVVQWLRIGAPRLCEGLANALRHHDMNGPALELRAGDLSISSVAQVFVCRKAIGWFFLMPTTAASVLVSVLRVCDDDTAQEVQKLLGEPLLLNYSGVREYLQKLTADDTAKSRVEQVLAQNESYLEALRAVPLIKELQPSEHHRRIERLRMADQMWDAHKKAQSQSVLLNLVKRSVLLYGNRSLSFIKDEKDEFRPLEMDLKPFGVSLEMPRMELIDPVGLDFTLRVFRMERMVS
jgi:hypothetical protein